VIDDADAVVLAVGAKGLQISESQITPEAGHAAPELGLPLLLSFNRCRFNASVAGSQ